MDVIILYVLKGCVKNVIKYFGIKTIESMCKIIVKIGKVRKIMQNLIRKFNCWLDTIWFTIKHSFKTGETIPVMGHIYDQHEVIRNCVLVISYCSYCGNKTFAWHKEGSIPDGDMMKMYGTLEGKTDFSNK
jgi:hypothetical protein